MDLKKMCRTCLCSNETMFPLFDANLELMDTQFSTAVEILEAFTSATISNKDFLPDHICGSCLIEMRRAYSFKMKCEKSEMLLNQLKKVEINLNKLTDLSNQNEIDSEINYEIQSNIKEEPQEIFELYDCNEFNESECKLNFNEISPKIQYAQVECVPDFQMNFKTEPELEIKDIDCGDNELKADGQLKCSACEKQFESLNLFYVHIVTDHMEGKLCKLCNEEIYCSQFDHSFKHPPINYLDEKNFEKPSELSEDLKKQTTFCQHCSEHFTDLNMLKLHACSRFAPNRSDYREMEPMEENTEQSHVEATDTNEVMKSKSKHPCSICSKVYGRKNSLTIHMRIHTGETPFQCKFCSEKFRLRQFLRVHMENKHVNELPDGKPKFQCNVCSRIFSCNNHLVGHMLIHSGEKPFQCKYCPDKFRHKPSAILHMKTLHLEEMENDKPQYQCSICSEGFHYNCDLVTHMRIHIDENQFQCEFCSQKFQFKYMIRVHMEKNHTNELPDGKPTYQCDVCSKVFGYNSDLVRHMRSHTDEKPFQCKVCFSDFRYRHLLRVHMESQHLDELPIDKPKYQCNICSKIFAYNNNLVKHMRVHTGEKPFQCKICSQKFQHKHSLRIHMETKHINDLPDYKPKHQCSICSKIFDYARSLRTHLETKHTNELPADKPPKFQCHLCSKVFPGNHHLARHILVHTGEKPFKCETCTNAFRSNKELRRHVLVKHATYNSVKKDSQSLDETQ